MSVRILSDKDDKTAVIYCQNTDTAFGPVVYTHGSPMSASQLMAKFLEFLACPADRMDEQEVMEKYAEFARLEWKECPECYSDLIYGSLDACFKCRTTCDECGDRDVVTHKTHRRLCKACEAELVKA